MEKRTAFQVLDDLFFQELRQIRNYEAAYNKATERFEKEHNLANEMSYDAYRMRKKRKARR